MTKDRKKALDELTQLSEEMGMYDSVKAMMDYARGYEDGKKAVAGIMCACGSKNTAFTGHGGYQEADASRGLPEIDVELVECRNCGRIFYY